MTPDTREEFEKHVERRAIGERWPWTGPTLNGRAVIHVDGEVHSARRVAWEIEHHMALPDGTILWHREDDPLDMNPARLRTAAVTAGVVRAMRGSDEPDESYVAGYGLTLDQVRSYRANSEHAWLAEPVEA